MRIVTHISTQGGTNSDFVKQYYLKFSVLKGSWMDYKENGVLKVCLSLSSVKYKKDLATNLMFHTC